MTPMAKPLPVINEDNRRFYEFTAKHELRMQQCSQCGYIRFPSSFICPKCHATEHEWTRLSGRGTIYSYAVYRTAYHPAFENEIPYFVTIIDLAEGPSLESNVTGCQPEVLKIGLPVEVYFEDINEEIAIPKFRLVTSF
jgi:uncharacterized protein